MKKLMKMGLVILAATPAFAEKSANEVLLSAIASCPQPNNPLLNGLKKLKGNSFENLKLEAIGDMDEYTDAVIVTADVNFDPRIAHSLANAPVRKLGSIAIFVGRWSADVLSPGTTQRCNLKVARF